MRRGVHDALTYSINFSMDSTMLCSVSSRGTCHVWKLSEETEKKRGLVEGSRSVCQIQIPDFSAKTGFSQILFGILEISNSRKNFFFK